MGTIKEIAQERGITEKSVRYYAFDAYNRKSKKDNPNRLSLVALDDDEDIPLPKYALYKGKNIIDTGTLEELSKKKGVSITCIKYYGTKSYKKRHGNSPNRLMLVKLEEEDY